VKLRILPESVFGRRPVHTVAWGNAPGMRCNPAFLAEGHTHTSRRNALNMAFGQTTDIAICSWGGAPGYGECGLRPGVQPANAQLQNPLGSFRSIGYPGPIPPALLRVTRQNGQYYAWLARHSRNYLPDGQRRCRQRTADAAIMSPGRRSGGRSARALPTRNVRVGEISRNALASGFRWETAV
jgi:hypothetical protein